MRRLILLLVILLVSTSTQAGDFQTGWWIDVNRPEMLAQFASEGQTLILASSAIWFTNSGDNTIKTFLDTAQTHNMKVILGLCPAWEMPTQNFVNAINAHKGHPALYGWYIGDEPELYGWYIHDYLDVNPGFYHLVKQNDPNHPALISFNYPYNGFDTIRPWYDVTDIIGVHAYPVYSVYPTEFSTGENRLMYDLWKSLAADAVEYGKDAIATCMGFGDNTIYPYKTPTYREIRYHVFSAVVQGIDKVLFWMYNGWGDQDPKALDNVRRMVAEMQSIGAEMNAGETSIPEILVSASTDRLAYRYGVSGESHVILAVNIANRMSGGTNLDDVQFTLPVNMNAVESVEVLHEGRTIPVVGGTFVDSFKPFGVHIYKFISSTSSPSPPPPSPSCNYSISPIKNSFNYTGSSGTVSVTTESGCSWTATSNVSWIAVTSGASGTGSGKVSYSVAANAGATTRTGTITIAGKIFTVTQAGARISDS